MELTRKGKLFVLSGFSGAGKGTIMNTFLERYDGYSLSVSATTREKREGEYEGVHYYFKTREEFEEMIERQALVEYTEYQGNYYGTPRAYLEERIANGEDVFLEIEVDGGSQIKKIFPGAVLIFVTTPNAAELRRRLMERGSNTPEEIEGRLRRAAAEAAFVPSYDYLLVNDDLSDCVDLLYDITQVAHSETIDQSAFPDDFANEIRQLIGEE